MIHVEPLRRVIDGVLSVAWALACATCDALLETPTQGVVCGKCWRDLPLITAPVCERCGGPRIDVAGRCSLRSLSSAGRHERRRRMPPRRRLLRGHVALGHSRVQVSRTALTCQTVGGPHAPGRRDLLDWADVVVPVPLHPRRRWERGFNQATELAAYLGPPVVSALRRTRTTPPQATLSARRRRLNVGGTFGGGTAGRRVAVDTRADDRKNGRRGGWRHDHRSNPRSLREDSAGGGRTRSVWSYDCASRRPTTSAISSPTSVFARSPSTRNQPGC